VDLQNEAQPQEQSQQSQMQQEQKPERVDELDIFGGLLIKLGKYFVAFYRNLFKNQRNQ